MSIILSTATVTATAIAIIFTALSPIANPWNHDPSDHFSPQAPLTTFYIHQTATMRTEAETRRESLDSNIPARMAPYLDLII
jgi:hypothetical protein